MTNSIIPFLVLFASASSPSLLFGQQASLAAFTELANVDPQPLPLENKRIFGHYSEQPYLAQSERV